MSDPLPPLERYRDWLLLLARLQVGRRLQAKFDASDIVQLALLEATRALPGFRGSTEAELLAWLRTILARVIAHEVRRYAGTQERDASRELSLEADLAESSRRLGEALAAEQTSPSQAAQKRERAVLLAEALARLPANYREVIVMRNLEGLSHEEIAVQMGRASGAIRMLWVRALARLRQELVRMDGEL
jgi:RNA polymerase sigma-70 factor (ECF subfamily)